MRLWIPWAVLLLLSAPPMTARAAEPPATPPSDEKPAAAEPKTDEAKDKDEKDERLQVYEEIQVIDRASDMVGVADSASEGVTGRKQLEQRPVLRPGELLETVPGRDRHPAQRRAARRTSTSCAASTSTTGPTSRITVDGIPVNMPHPRATARATATSIS